MKIRFEITGDEIEDRDELFIYVLARDNYNKIFQALNHIRSRLKYQDPSEEEIKTLEELREILNIEI